MSHCKILTFLCAVFTVITISCQKDQIILTEKSFDWPENARSYWPTNAWEIADLEEQGIDSQKMQRAKDYARKDELSRALLVVKNGYLVCEEYYGNGGPQASTNLWSVTKSVTSALVGILYDQNKFSGTQRLMSELMPQYPEFEEITLHHVLTMTTGLNWVEHGPLWVQWIFSDDWTKEALSRGSQNQPGSNFFYSSGNSHFLTTLIDAKTDISVGAFAKQHLFEPLGIEFNEIDKNLQYKNWEEYKKPVYQTWRKDPNGIECAGFGLYLTARDMAKFGFLFLNRGKWDGKTIVSEEWVKLSTTEHVFNVYERYSYGYQWFITDVGGHPSFLASGYGGQIIGVVPSLDMVVVIKYDAENPVDPKTGTSHDDMHLFELIVNAVANKS